MMKKFKPRCRSILAAGILAMGLVAPSLVAADGGPTTFERVFGVPGDFDPAMVAKVKALPPGERLAVDRNGDGKNDEVWFIDTARRHTDPRRPILVRVIDEDGDLDRTGADLDSDLYLADWRADGTIDAVVDYQDNDGDGDVDEMGIYFGKYQQPWLDKDTVKVWWSRDVGDDNRLWYDVDWNYEQNACQYRSHFSGAEVFYQFALGKGSTQWLNVFEDPFAFYDPDGDGCSEVVVRICAVGHEVSSLRYSMDVDNDAHGRHTHDYDFSITALPAKGAVTTDSERGVSFQVRGIATHSALAWHGAREFAAAAPWAKVLLTWDEMNANTAADVQRDPHERWEGIINHKSAHFPQVGGPPCSPLNKRNEIAFKPEAPLRLYYDPTDHRLHLLGASEGWLHVDFDLDGQIDARTTYRDDNGDGIFDRREVDLDADGQVDFNWKMQGRAGRQFALEFAPLAAFYQAKLAETLADSQALIDAAKGALGGERATRDPAETFFLTKLADWQPQTGLGRRMRSTPAGARYALDLVRDRLFLALSRKFGTHARWHEVAAAYEAGAYRAAAELVREQFTGAAAPAAARYRSFTRRIPLPIDNRSKAQRDHWPITVALRDLRKIAADFTPDRCAVVAPQRWLDWRQVPHQIDQIDPATGRELSFLADLPASRSVTYYLYYAPTADEPATFPARTGAAEDWVPPNIGWESNRCAYRAYWGQFDFFGKKTGQLIYKDIGSKSYHQEVEWGIDALHVGRASGLGGLTLYQGDRAWPVQNPAGDGQVDFTKRIVVQGPVRCAIRLTAKNIVPANPELTLGMLCLIYAEHQETEIRLTATGADGELVVAPGIVKLPREETFADVAAGCFGTWGWQEDAIGRIGMGLIVAPDAVVDVRIEPAERRIRCRTDGGRLRYWLIGDWRRGRPYPIAPAKSDWQREVQSLARLLLDEVRLEPAPAEVVQ